MSRHHGGGITPSHRARRVGCPLSPPACHIASGRRGREREKCTRTAEQTCRRIYQVPSPAYPFPPPHASPPALRPKRPGRAPGSLRTAALSGACGPAPAGGARGTTPQGASSRPRSQPLQSWGGSSTESGCGGGGGRRRHHLPRRYGCCRCCCRRCCWRWRTSGTRPFHCGLWRHRRRRRRPQLGGGPPRPCPRAHPRC